VTVSASSGCQVSPVGGGRRRAGDRVDGVWVTERTGARGSAPSGQYSSCLARGPHRAGAGLEPSAKVRPARNRGGGLENSGWMIHHQCPHSGQNANASRLRLISCPSFGRSARNARRLVDCAPICPTIGHDVIGRKCQGRCASSTHRPLVSVSVSSATAETKASNRWHATRRPGRARWAARWHPCPARSDRAAGRRTRCRRSRRRAPRLRYGSRAERG